MQTRLPPRPKGARTVERSIEIGCPVDRVFRFFRDPRNAPKVTSDVEFLSITGPFPLDDGDVFDVRMRPRLFPRVLHWRFVCEAVVHNSAVIDVALKSPFPYWRIEHRVEALSTNRTRVTHRLQYLPLLPGPLAKLAGGIVDRRLSGTLDGQLRASKALLERR